MNQGADDVVNDRYRQSMMARTMQGMDKNARLEQLQAELVGQDGQIDEVKFKQYAAADPVNAKALREAIEGPKTRWQLGQIGDGAGGTVDVLYDPMNPGTMQSIDGQPLLGGAAQTASAGQPQFGILRDAVEQVESGGDPLAVSPAGAIGPMQTMPGTLRDPGFGVAPARDGSIEEQRRVGNDYLGAMLNKYADPRLALAAYNAGPGRVDGAMSAGGGVEAALGRLPAETQAYVPKVMGRAQGGAPALPSGLGRRPKVVAAKTQADWSPMSAADVEAAGLPPGSVAQRNATTGQIQTIRLPTAASTAGGKPLTQGTVKELTSDAGRLANLTSLGSSFKNEYAGNKWGGGAENLVGRLGLPGATPGQAEWWQGYDRIKNEIRNELFGASLTDSEKRAFEASDITPDMAPSVIKANLAKQEQIIQNALKRKAGTWQAQGYNKQALNFATDGILGEDGAPAADKPQSNRLRFNPKTGKLE